MCQMGVGYVENKFIRSSNKKDCATVILPIGVSAYDLFWYISQYFVFYH